MFAMENSPETVVFKNIPSVSSISNKLNKKGKTPFLLMEIFYLGIWVFIVNRKAFGCISECKQPQNEKDLFFEILPKINWP